MEWSRELASAIEHSAAPAAVTVALERLTQSSPGLLERLEADETLRDAVVAVTGASRSLTELCHADPAALEVLQRLDERVALDAKTPEELRRGKRLELLRIAARDLLGIDDLTAVGRNLAELAADVLQRACDIAGADNLAVIGMGKLGGVELNYASDVDVLFVSGARGPDGTTSSGDRAEAADRAARAVLEVARTCFRVDVDLRPEGRDGPLVRTLESYEAYWDRWAQTWEFQALIKARPVAGNAEVGDAFAASTEQRVWGRPFTADDLRAVRDMKARSEAHLARRGLSDREVKRGRGGIRDIEFAVQLLQLVHGGHDPAIRSRTTLDALAVLAGSGYVEADDAGALAEAYRVLRAVEHRLQLVHEQQVHTLPSDPASLDRLARVMGYRDTPHATARELLADELRRQQATVRTIHERLFFRPLLDALVGGPSPAAMSPEAVTERLAAFGFSDAERTRQALRELTRGLTRSSRLMQQVLPLVLSWLSESPDPDLGLLGLRKLTTGEQRSTALAVAFRESPEAARRLCLLLGTSRRLGQTVERHPDLIPELGDAHALATRTAEALDTGALAALAWRSEVDERQAGLERFRRREEVRVAAADILELSGAEDPVVVTAGQLTALAEACVRAALTTVDPPLPFAVVAMGRFGGAELSYASDLDLLFVYDGTTSEDFAAAEKAGEEVLRFLMGPTPASRVYPVDLDLRPEGKDGPVTRSLEGYQSYLDRWAQTWERQALVRARPVAGDLDVGRRFLELVEPHLWSRALPDAEVREIRRMKARIERERIPPGEDPQFHLKLGRGSLSDVEFTAQLLQLRHGVRGQGTMAALDALAAAGVLGDDDHRVLAEAYRFCERTRNRWFLIKGAVDDSLPGQPEWLARLARSLGNTPVDLREHYRRVTRRSRQVVERLFYGKGD